MTEVADLEQNSEPDELSLTDQAPPDIIPELQTASLHQDEELPPDYSSVSSPCSEVDGAPYSPLSNEVESSLVAEAPPSYKQLFGNAVDNKVEAAVSANRLQQGRRHSQRPHTRSRRRRRGSEAGHGDLLSKLQKKLSNENVASSCFVVFIAMLFLLSLAMVIIGSLNVNVCQSTVVPLYLLVAGLIQMCVLVFQTATWIGERFCRVESCHTVRLFDIFGCILFIWLVVGSNWIVRVGWNRDTCVPFGHDYVYPPSNLTMQDFDLEETEASLGGNPCRDCASGVYLFTSVVIVLQYIAIVLMCISCCSSLYKTRRSHSQHSRV